VTKKAEILLIMCGIQRKEESSEEEESKEESEEEDSGSEEDRRKLKRGKVGGGSIPSLKIGNVPGCGKRHP
jgi:hypothetical protein